MTSYDKDPYKPISILECSSCVFSTALTDFLHLGTLTHAVSQACFKRKLSYLKAPQKSRGQKVGVRQSFNNMQPANNELLWRKSMDSSRMNGCGTAFIKAFLT